MARQCCVPGCMVLLTSRAPMCHRDWSRVDPEDRKIIDAQRMDAEYIAALQRGIDKATQRKPTNMGRTGATYPHGPNIA